MSWNAFSYRVVSDDTDGQWSWIEFYGLPASTRFHVPSNSVVWWDGIRNKLVCMLPRPEIRRKGFAAIVD